MAWQNNTLAGSTGVAYLLAYATPVNTVSIAATSGDFWVRVRKNSTGIAPGVNPAIVASPATPPLTQGWIHLAGSNSTVFGNDRLGPDSPHDVIVEIDVWCASAGELLFGAH